MTTLRIALSEAEKAALEARASERGYNSAEQYAQELLRAGLVEEDTAIERVLLERLNDPREGIEFTETFKQQFRSEIRERRQHGKQP